MYWVVEVRYQDFIFVSLSTGCWIWGVPAESENLPRRENQDATECLEGLENEVRAKLILERMLIPLYIHMK